MKFKKLFISILGATLVATSVFSARAVESKSTGSVYMDGYELYGKVTVYPLNAYGYTYCEKTSAGKKADTYYAYYDTSGILRECGVYTSGYIYNGKTSLSQETKSPSTNLFDYYAGAMTISQVIYPNQTYYNWTSEGTDNELRLGVYAR